jgi:hypothetical protein
MELHAAGEMDQAQDPALIDDRPPVKPSASACPVHCRNV